MSDWNPDALYDVSEIENKQAWAGYFSRLFPDRTFLMEWVGTRSQRINVWMPQERSSEFFVYQDMFAFPIKNGRISMGTHAYASEDDQVAKEIQMDVWDGEYIATVWADKSNEKGFTEGRFEKRKFADLHLVKAREFTQEEINSLERARIEAEIAAKQKEIDVLKAGMPKASLGVEENVS